MQDRSTHAAVGAAAFMAGGRVAGGRVLTDWPGLFRNAPHESRDLRPTLDLRAVFKGLLAEQFALSSITLERDIFPDSASAGALPGLLA